MTDPEQSPPGSRTLAPAEVRALAHARRDARLAHEWREADRLRAEIESAGWRVVDRGVDFALRPAVPPDVVIDGVTLYGSSASVPSVLDAPPDRRATIVLLATADTADTADTIERTDTIDRPLAHGDAGDAHQDQLVVVLAEADERDHPRGWSAADADILRLAGAPTPGARLAAGLRRARGARVVAVEGMRVPGMADLARLLETLDDPSVACAGAHGATTSDLRNFAPVEMGDADVLLPGLVAFRRQDAVASLPVDERFVSSVRTMEWWSLHLRDRDEAVPRRAIVVPGLSATSSATRALAASDDRVWKRDFYRLHDAFAGRDDLLSGLG